MAVGRLGTISPAWPWTEPAWGRRFDRGLANCRRYRCSCFSNGLNAASDTALSASVPSDPSNASLTASPLERNRWQHFSSFYSTIFLKSRPLDIFSLPPPPLENAASYCNWWVDRIEFVEKSNIELVLCDPGILIGEAIDKFAIFRFPDSFFDQCLMASTCCNWLSLWVWHFDETQLELFCATTCWLHLITGRLLGAQRWLQLKHYARCNWN